MNDIIYEISKHVSTAQRIIFKLISKNLYNSVKIYKLDDYLKLNDERIDLLPDLKELYYEHLKLPNRRFAYRFDLNKISRLRLVSFIFVGLGETSFTHLPFDLSILYNMKSLKYLDINGDYYGGITNLNDTLLTLDLEYFKIDNYESHSFDSMKHMKLKLYENSYANNNEMYDNNKKYLRYIYNITIDDLISHNLMDCNIHTLDLWILDEADFKVFKNMKIHKLKLGSPPFRNQINFNFLKDMKLYELHISSIKKYAMPSIEILKSIKLKKLYIYAYENYTDEELNQLDGTEVIFHKFSY